MSDLSVYRSNCGPPVHTYAGVQNNTHSKKLHQFTFLPLAQKCSDKTKNKQTLFVTFFFRKRGSLNSTFTWNLRWSGGRSTKSAKLAFDKLSLSKRLLKLLEDLKNLVNMQIFLKARFMGDVPRILNRGRSSPALSPSPGGDTHANDNLFYLIQTCAKRSQICYPQDLKSYMLIYPSNSRDLGSAMEGVARGPVELG